MAKVAQNHDEQKWADALAALHGVAFAEYLRGCRWFGGKAQTLRGVQLLEALTLGDVGKLILLQVNYLEAPAETYLLPLQLAVDDGGLVDALEDEAFRAALLKMIVDEQRLCCDSGELVGICGAEFKAQAMTLVQPLASRLLKVEQSNSSILYADQFFLKLYRRPERGENPEAELLRHLGSGEKFANVPGYCGVIEYREKDAEPRVLALLVTNVPCEGTAWTSMLSALAQPQDGDIGDSDLDHARRLGVVLGLQQLGIDLLFLEFLDEGFELLPFARQYGGLVIAVVKILQFGIAVDALGKRVVAFPGEGFGQIVLLFFFLGFSTAGSRESSWSHFTSSMETSTWSVL